MLWKSSKKSEQNNQNQTSSVQQQQQDGCGWYAIAFATTLLYGKGHRKFCYEPRKFFFLFQAVCCLSQDIPLKLRSLFLS